MNNEKTKELLYKAISKLPCSVIIMARVLSDVKLQCILKKHGAGKPIVIIYGEPGNGKTSSVRTLLGEHREIKFVNGLREVKKVVKSMMDIEINNDNLIENPILFLDNFPQPLSQRKLEIGREICDYIIDIVSENENAPITIITGEMNLLKELKKAISLQERSLMIKMNKIDDDIELYEIRNYFSIYQLEYKNLWEKYRKWSLKNEIVEEDVLEKLIQFRKKYSRKYENRQIGLVFCYYFSIYRFCEFLENIYGEEVQIGKIEKNIKELFDWEKIVGKTHQSYEVEVWKSFIKDKEMNRVYIPNTNACKLLVEGTCDEYYQYECYRGCKYVCENYDPMTLRLHGEAVLIKNPLLIPYFPKHIACDTPLLIIGKDVLLKMLNIYLEKYTRKMKVSVETITPKKFTKEMFSNNRCLFKYEGVERGNTYTFAWKTDMNKDIRVLFIKLTEDEYNNLNAIAEPTPTMENYNEMSVYNMNQCLKKFVNNVRNLIGEIGTASVIIDKID